MPVQTSFKSFTDKWKYEIMISFFFNSSFFLSFSWNEWLTLPLRYCDLPRHAILALSIHEIISPTEIRIIGSTTITLFDSDG
jgi:phosphatidylinositol 3-kinase